jgi:hypothetical protein
MTKTELKRKLRARKEADTNRAIADIFAIREQAVQQWPDKEHIPMARYYELIVKRPELVRPEFFSEKAHV